MLGADLSEDSASAAALSGITALSDSPSDRILSPVALSSGTVFSYLLPFGDKDSVIWGCHNGVRIGFGHGGSGVTWISHPDYNWRDYYLSYALGYQELALGYTQHLVFEDFSTGEAHYSLGGDLGLIGNYSIYGAELRWLRIGKKDAQVHITAITNLSDDSSIATDYVFQVHGKDSYRVASSIGIGDFIKIQSSWQSEPARFGFGIKLALASTTIMYAVRTHPEMDLSHGVEIGFSW